MVGLRVPLEKAARDFLLDASRLCNPFHARRPDERHTQHRESKKGMYSSLLGPTSLWL